MPTLPSSPAPQRVTPPQIIDPILIQQFDQGHEHRRSRYSHARRRYNLEYLVSADDLHILLDFFERQTRGGVLSFDWDYPYSHNIAGISTNIPNILTTAYEHGLQTNDQVVVDDTASHDGTYTITWFSTTKFLLVGTSGGTAEGAIGTVRQHFPKMAIVAPEQLPLPAYREGFGALQNDSGLFDFAITLEEKFG